MSQNEMHNLQSTIWKRIKCTIEISAEKVVITNKKNKDRKNCCVWLLVYCVSEPGSKLFKVKFSEHEINQMLHYTITPKSLLNKQSPRLHVTQQPEECPPELSSMWWSCSMCHVSYASAILLIQTCSSLPSNILQHHRLCRGQNCITFMNVTLNEWLWSWSHLELLLCSWDVWLQRLCLPGSAVVHCSPCLQQKASWWDWVEKQRATLRALCTPCCTAVWDL